MGWFGGSVQRVRRGAEAGDAVPRDNRSLMEKRGWRDFFVEEDIRSIDASYQVLKVTRQNEVVFARVREEVTVHRVSGKSSRKRDNLLWTQLTYGPQGWRQIRASKATQ